MLEDKTRIPLLIDARQTLGEIHERYRDQILNVTQIQDVYGIEEYFSVTALGHAMCSAELDMRKNAISDLDEAFSTWHGAARRICLNLVMRKDPERFLFSAYAGQAKTAEITDWLDFAHGTEKGIEWVDNLRANASTVRVPQFSLDESEKQGIEIMRKLVARNRILEGYISQYRFLESSNARPSNVQKYFDTLKEEDKVEDCFLFIADDEKG